MSAVTVMAAGSVMKLPSRGPTDSNENRKASSPGRGSSRETAPIARLSAAQTIRRNSLGRLFSFELGEVDQVKNHHLTGSEVVRRFGGIRRKGAAAMRLRRTLNFTFRYG